MIAMLRQPFQSLPTPSQDAFAGKTAIITGANKGLGFETARHFLSSGGIRLIIAARNVERGEKAKEELYKTAKITHDARIDVWELDMGSFESVKRFAKKVADEAAADRVSIDYLFLNAGTASDKFSKTSDGWETVLQVNGIATTLLTLLLVPVMVAQSRKKVAKSGADAASKIIITTSGLHTVTNFTQHTSENSLQKLNEEEGFDGVDQYAVSKLINVYTAEEIAKIIPLVDDQGSPAVIINSVDPGLTHSEIYDGVSPLSLRLMLYFFGRKTEVGSRNLTQAAILGKEAHGGFIHSAKLDTPGKMVTSPQGKTAQRKVWGELIAVLKQISPEVEEIAQGKGF